MLCVSYFTDADDTDNRGNKVKDDMKQKKVSNTLIDKIKDFMLLGASALIIIAKNANIGKEV